MCDLKRRLSAHGTRREIDIATACHLTAALAVGWVFRHATGWQPAARATDGMLCRRSPSRVHDGLKFNTEYGSYTANGGVLAADIDLVPRHIGSTVDRSLEAPPRARLSVSRRDNAAQMLPTEFGAVAGAIASELKRLRDQVRPAASICSSPPPQLSPCCLGPNSARWTALCGSTSTTATATTPPSNCPGDPHERQHVLPQLLDDIAVAMPEIRKARAKRDELAAVAVAALKAWALTNTGFFASGALAAGTQIRPLNDVDLVVYAGNIRNTWSEHAAPSPRGPLCCAPQRGLRVRDLHPRHQSHVPRRLVHGRRRFRVHAPGPGLWIPHCPDDEPHEWIRTDPKEHARQIRDRNSTIGVEFARELRILKVLNRKWGLPDPDGRKPVTSHHLNALALAIIRSPVTYATTTPAFLDRAAELVVHPLRDPSGVGPDLEARDPGRAAALMLAAADATRRALVAGDDAGDILKDVFGDPATTVAAVTGARLSIGAGGAFTVGTRDSRHRLRAVRTEMATSDPVTAPRFVGAAADVHGIANDCGRRARGTGASRVGDAVQLSGSGVGRTRRGGTATRWSGSRWKGTSPRSTRHLPPQDRQGVCVHRRGQRRRRWRSTARADLCWSPNAGASHRHGGRAAHGTPSLSLGAPYVAVYVVSRRLDFRAMDVERAPSRPD